MTITWTHHLSYRWFGSIEGREDYFTITGRFDEHGNPRFTTCLKTKHHKTLKDFPVRDTLDEARHDAETYRHD